MNSPKGLSQIASIIIIIVIGIIAAGGIWYYWQYRVLPDLEKSSNAVEPKVNNNAKNNANNTTNQTADWKTYTSEKYNYSIKYPRDWTSPVDKGTDSSEPNRVSWVEFQNTTSYGDAVIVAEVLKNTYSSINEWAQKMNQGAIGAIYDIKDATVAGVAGKQLSTAAEGGAVRTGIIKSDKLYVVHLIYTFSQKDKNNLDKVYQTMLSTFKFTK